jgi:hypothetical protein
MKQWHSPDEQKQQGWNTPPQKAAQSQRPYRSEDEPLRLMHFASLRGRE